VRDFDLYAKIKNARIDLCLDKNNPLLVGDETHLRNMMYNLIDNALKYSNGRDPEIKITTQQRESELLISVEDNGVGMNHDELKKVFDKFYRIPTGYIHNIKGFGLGLSYVKTVVNLHNGKIKVASEPGVGSAFIIQFQNQN
ncbi:MAG: sensor histidine kinase, partial [Chitinophagales bacterium]